jgi:hydrogenase nickel incorporation protein HypA/HybF
MHELSLAIAMVREVEAVMAREGVSELVLLRVGIGELSGVERAAFELCFPVAAEGTRAEGAELCIDELPVELSCAACGERAPALDSARFAAVCAACGATEVDIVGGRDLVIRSLEVR